MNDTTYWPPLRLISPHCTGLLINVWHRYETDPFLGSEFMCYCDQQSEFMDTLFAHKVTMLIVSNNILLGRGRLFQKKSLCYKEGVSLNIKLLVVQVLYRNEIWDSWRWNYGNITFGNHVYVYSNSFVLNEDY